MSGSENGPLEALRVDDDERVCDLVAVFFQRDEDRPDCRITSETSPEDALAQVRAEGQPFDCVLTDYNMPGMTGIELLEAIRRDARSSRCCCSRGEAPMEISAEAIRTGLTDYLRKRSGGDAYTMLIRRVKHAVDSDGQFEPTAETQL